MTYKRNYNQVIHSMYQNAKDSDTVFKDLNRLNEIYSSERAKASEQIFKITKSMMKRMRRMK